MPKVITKDYILQRIEVDRRGCWNWTGQSRSTGHGYIGSYSKTAYRESYKLWIGPIEEGMFLDHRCHNPRCVNPDHLFQCTRSMNVMLGYVEKNRQLPWRWLRIARHLHRMVGDAAYRERVSSGEVF